VRTNVTTQRAPEKGKTLKTEEIADLTKSMGGGGGDFLFLKQREKLGIGSQEKEMEKN